jgi:ATP-dependent exoDNAse (exonuclease V) alpha subunit
VVPLLDRRQEDAMATVSGRRFPAGEERSYSTPELLLLEGWAIDRALQTRGERRGQVDERDVDRALAGDAFLSEEQQNLVRRLTRDGDGVAVIVGKAGTGKTTALSTARAAWVAGEVSVLGCAVSHRAAKELEEGSGIPSTSLAAVLHSLDRPEARLPDGAVLVVDEAGLLGTRDAARLLAHVDDAHGKLVLTGDTRQLPSISAGGLLAGLATRLEPIRLNDNRRQQHEWERDALDRLREGKVGPALDAYADHGRITHAADWHQATGRLVADWHATGDPDGTVMIAHYRRDVAELNARARYAMRTLGRLGDVELDAGGLAFAVGDRIVVRRNDHRLDVRNGDRGVVTAVDLAERKLTVRIGDHEGTLPHAFMESRTRSGDPAVQHGYAMTAYVAQGLTCRTALVLVHEDADREWAYTALSRGRERNQLYTVARNDAERLEYAPASPDRDPNERLDAALTRSRQQRLAIEQTSDVLRRARAHDEIAQMREGREQQRSADHGIGREL